MQVVSPRLLLSFLGMFCFSALLSVTVFAQMRTPTSPATNLDPNLTVATVTLQITAAPAHAQAQARAAAPGKPAIKTVNGKPLMRLSSEQNGQTIEAPQGTFILLRFPGATGFVVNPPGILEPPPGRYHFPNGVIGMVRAVSGGTATLIVRGLPRIRPASTFNGSGSANWSGYAKNGGPFTSISGEWTVPWAAANVDGQSSTWIGIDGHTNDNLIQTGTHQDYSSGFLGSAIGSGSEYYAWWEVLPDEEQRFPNPVSPGDQMIGILSMNGNSSPGSPMTFLIFLMNVTQHWTATKTVNYSGELDSAEWIMEAPMNCVFILGCSEATLANYGSVTFDSFDTVNSGSPTFTPADSITMVRANNVVSSPSFPDADGDGFSLAYGALPPGPPGPQIFTSSLPDAYINLSYKEQVHGISDAPFGWFVLNLPSWLSFDAPTGTLRGTPIMAGEYSFTLGANDTADQRIAAEKQLSITVQKVPPPPDFSLSVLPSPLRLITTSNSPPCDGFAKIVVTPLFGFNAPVELTVTATDESTGQLNPTSTMGTSLLTVNTPYCFQSGQFHIVTVTGKSGSITHSMAVLLQPPPHGNPCTTSQGQHTGACQQPK
jgi:hypothetical protein